MRMGKIILHENCLKLQVCELWHAASTNRLQFSVEVLWDRNFPFLKFCCHLLALVLQEAEGDSNWSSGTRNVCLLKNDLIYV